MFGTNFFSKPLTQLFAVILFVLSSVLAQAVQITAGSTVMMSVTADGTAPFTYQWKKDGINVVGAIGPTLTISNIQNSNAGSYSVQVANTAGATTSDISSITVVVPTSAPVITTQPISQNVTVGTRVVFTASANGTPTPTLQWRRNGVNISGATGGSYSIASVAAGDAASYSVVASNSAGSTASSAASLTVTAKAEANAIAYKATTFPATVVQGATVNFSYTVTNTGTQFWGSNYYLGLRDANDQNLTFSSLSGVAVGESTSANLTFTAPSVPGTYIYHAQALQNGVAWFGNQVELVLTVVATSRNSISYNTSSFPVTVVSGAKVKFSYNVTNKGTQAWGVNHYLGLRDENYNNLAFASLNGVAVGGSTTTSLSFTAPSTPGTYTYHVQALENGVMWFSTQADLILTVVAPALNAISYNATTFPTVVTAGRMVTFSYNVTNTGTQAWGSNHYLGLRDGNYNNLAFVSLVGVPVAGSKTVSLSFVAPSAPGTYTYYVQGLENGVAWFSTKSTITLTVPPTPLVNAISYDVTNIPATATAGAAVNFTYKVTNTGTQAWGSEHYLSLRDENGNYLDFALVDGVAIGGSTTAALRLKAPTTPGTYTYYIQALENGKELFSTQATLILTVY